MLEYYPGRHNHLITMQPQAAQVEDARLLRGLDGFCAIEHSAALTAFDGARCVGIGGVYGLPDGKGLLWVVMSEYAPRHLVAITRKVRRILAALPHTHYVLTVKQNFEQGDRWARLLGFYLIDPNTGAQCPYGRGYRLYAYDKV